MTSATTLPLPTCEAGSAATNKQSESIAPPFTPPQQFTIPLTVEHWRPVEGYEGIYEVSSLGRVKRVKAGPKTYPGRILKDRATKEYRLVDLYKDTTQSTKQVHKLVAEAFLEPCPEGYQVNHKDGVKAHNCAGNLEHVTPSDNQRHAYEHGLKSNQGTLSPSAKLTDADVLAIRASSKTGVVLAEQHNVHYSTISLIRRSKIWVHLN